MDLSINRLIAEADAASHMFDVRSEELARARQDAEAIVKTASQRFNDAAQTKTQSVEKLHRELAKRGLTPNASR